MVVEFVVPSPVPILPCHPSVMKSMFSLSCFTEIRLTYLRLPPARVLYQDKLKKKRNVNNLSARGVTTTSRRGWVLKVRPWRAIRRRYSPLTSRKVHAITMARLQLNGEFPERTPSSESFQTTKIGMIIKCTMRLECRASQVSFVLRAPGPSQRGHSSQTTRDVRCKRPHYFVHLPSPHV